ncbi:hypothetical protein WJX73_003209 [Symbiochloris irregularis]|uniref:Metallo-beta-lactamase domain-containing protein n=1 Tax=Symbiochloris irregularis TaxID=706552 RepID=A0AAW1PY19_9CHLO
MLLFVLVLLVACQAASHDVIPKGPVTQLEPVPKDSIRIVALGTGTPDVRKAAVATSYLIQLGNGENFLFDLGTGSYINLVATGVPQDSLTKVFLSHLHSDHIADLASLYIGAMFGRTHAWEVWGPSGERPEFGTGAVIKGLSQFLAWDTHSRRKIDLIGRSDDGDKVIAHEFDYAAKNQVIYSRNGVTVTSTPVDHYATAGPVALRLDWNGLSITYSGDTKPTQTLVDLATRDKGTDVLLLQSMGPILDFAALPHNSQYLLNTSHITPTQAGAVLQDISPRLAAVHHLTVNDASRVAIVSDIRTGYPASALHIAEDLDVFEVSKDQIAIRKRLVPSTSWGYWHSDGEGVHAASGSGAAAMPFTRHSILAGLGLS